MPRSEFDAGQSFCPYASLINLMITLIMAKYVNMFGEHMQKKCFYYITI